ncbi:O-antigen ligase family protein [Terrarubrum flagellatum]|uniref:O-antigen ligase family protein n=1 Tax=Terrirubrum flagellatum TaxID=2895980 RepID=UPI0031456F1C
MDRTYLSPGRRDALIVACDHAARAAILYGLPLATAFANKAALPAVCVAAIFCVISQSLRNGSLISGLFALRPRYSPEFAIVALFVAYAVLSLTWTLNIRESAFALGETLIAVIASAIVTKGLAEYPREALVRHLCLSLIICSALVAFELTFNMPLRRMIGSRVELLQYNRAVEAMSLMAPYLISRLFDRSERRFVWLAVAVLAATALKSQTGSGMSAIFAGIVVMLLARMNLTVVRRCGLVCTLLALAAAPFVGEFLHQYMPVRLEKMLASVHAPERIEIWRIYGHSLRHAPLFGTGFGSSASVTSSNLVADAPEDIRALVAMHPHDIFLQIWTEMGAIGALLMAALIWRVYRIIGEQPREQQISSLTFMASSGALALVAHGAWQGWLIASIGAGVAILSLMSRSRAA